MRERLGLSSKDIVCITVSRITIDKGLATLAQAIHLSNTSGRHDVKYLIVGDGDYADTLQLEIETEMRAGRVIMTGARGDVSDLLNAADIFVFPTLHENLSNALLEAGAAGKAVIATNVGGNTEIITHRVTGLLVPPSDAESIWAAIRTLAGDPALQWSLANNLRRRIHDEFSLHRVCALLDQLYASVLSSGSSNQGK
jgi:glycosyltransferase involved in cell wall biosynthesis